MHQWYKQMCFIMVFSHTPWTVLIPTTPVIFFWPPPASALSPSFPIWPSSFVPFFFQLDPPYEIKHMISFTLYPVYFHQPDDLQGHPSSWNIHHFILFLCPNKTPSCIYTTFYISYHTYLSSSDGHLGWIQSLAIVDGAITDTGVWVVHAAWIIGVILAFVELICFHRYNT